MSRTEAALAAITLRHISAVMAVGRGSALYLDPFTGTLIWGTPAITAEVEVIATHTDVMRVLAALQAGHRGEEDLLDPDELVRAVAADARQRFGLVDTAERLAAEMEAHTDSELKRIEAEGEREARIEAILERQRAAAEITVTRMTASRAAPAPTEAELARERARAQRGLAVIDAARAAEAKEGPARARDARRRHHRPSVGAMSVVSGVVLSAVRCRC